MSPEFICHPDNVNANIWGIVGANNQRVCIKPDGSICNECCKKFFVESRIVIIDENGNPTGTEMNFIKPEGQLCKYSTKSDECAIHESDIYPIQCGEYWCGDELNDARNGDPIAIKRVEKLLK